MGAGVSSDEGVGSTPCVVVRTRARNGAERLPPAPAVLRTPRVHRAQGAAAMGSAARRHKKSHTRVI